MKTTVHEKNYKISQQLQSIINKKIAKIEKYFDENAACIIVCSRTGKTEKMEVTIEAVGQSFRAQDESRNMFSNIDRALSKIERQIVKNKERLKSVIRKDALEGKKFAFIAKSPKFISSEVVKNKSFDIKRLTVAEAELALDTIDHSFYIYANKTSGKIDVMYRRDDGNLGIIEINNASIK